MSRALGFCGRGVNFQRVSELVSSHRRFVTAWWSRSPFVCLFLVLGPNSVCIVCAGAWWLEARFVFFVVRCIVDFLLSGRLRGFVCPRARSVVVDIIVIL